MKDYFWQFAPKRSEQKEKKKKKKKRNSQQIQMFQANDLFKI